MQVKAATLLLILALGLLTVPLPAEAQQAGKVYKIGLLLFSSPSNPLAMSVLEAFRQAMEIRGYIEGKNFVMEYRSATGKAERLPRLAAELVRLNVDLLMAGHLPTALALKKATKTIPVVFVAVPGPFASGLVASLARPGGNVTGLTWNVDPQVVRKRLQLLKESVPTVSRVARISNPTFPGLEAYRREARAAARVLGLTFQSVEVREVDEFERAFDAIIQERPDAIFLEEYASPALWTHAGRIAEFAIKHRLPMMTLGREAVEAGALMSYSVNVFALWRRAAVYVDKILKGANPADLPVERPRKLDLVINLKTAKALGLTIPPSVLVRADRVIE